MVFVFPPVVVDVLDATVGRDIPGRISFLLANEGLISPGLIPTSYGTNQYGRKYFVVRHIDKYKAVRRAVSDLRSSDMIMRLVALSNLAPYVLHPIVQTAVLDRLTDNRAEVRELATWMLGPASVFLSVRRAVVSQLEDVSLYVRSSAILALAEYAQRPSISSAIRKRLGDKSVYVRISAAKALARIDGLMQLFEIAEHALDKGNATEKDKALNALAPYANMLEVRTILGKLLDEEQPEWTKQRVQLMLNTDHSSTAEAGAIVRRLLHEDLSTRRSNIETQTTGQHVQHFTRGQLGNLMANAMTELLFEADDEARYAAEQVLRSYLPPKRRCEFMLQYLDSHPGAVAINPWAVLILLVRCADDPHTHKYLLPTLIEGSRDERDAAGELLYRALPATEVIDYLLARTSDKSVAVRAAAVRQLAPYAEDPHVQEELLRFCKNKQVKVRATAMGILGTQVRTDSAVSILLQGLQDEAASVREAAVRGLARWRDEVGVSEALERRLEDPSEQVRKAVREICEQPL